VWTAIEIDARIRRARDSESGAFMQVRGTPEIDLHKISVQLPNEEELTFLARCEPIIASNMNAGPEPFAIKLSVGSFQHLVKRRHRSFEENTKLVRYLIQGLAAINRKWPLCQDQSAKFCSNLSEYKARGIAIPEFEFPSDDELANL
jgi:hypothetical protein